MKKALMVIVPRLSLLNTPTVKVWGSVTRGSKFDANIGG